MEPNNIHNVSIDQPNSQSVATFEPVAIIGMAGRFPKADSVEELWDRICNEEDCISRFMPEELRNEGVPPGIYQSPLYVAAAPVLSDIDYFDAAFFGITPREADLMDPQHRLFLESCWEAIEDAGYDPRNFGSAGLFAGARTDTYLMNILSQPGFLDAVGAFHIGLGNDLAFLTTRVSHLLNLRGPSISVHTACSTSLVAVHLACESLNRRECDAALAGGVAINVPHRVGYLYEEGSVQSPDGVCRVFDSGARGTVFGSGVGVVVLKRLDDALRDHDSIAAVIIGSAINNDGSDKASFTAPSVRGQVDVIREALRVAGALPESIGYVECHGTGTLLGDAIEVRALSKAFGKGSAGTCALGSIKSNVGHLDAASGVTGLIKTVLCLKHEILPASLHFEKPNPQIRFDGTRFYVNSRTQPWDRTAEPLRASVSAFGVGGTNAHVILEEPPQWHVNSEDCDFHILPLSARSLAALTRACHRLASHLEAHSELNLSDVGLTLQDGRHPFSVRRAFVCGSKDDAIQQLNEAFPTEREPGKYNEPIAPPISFLFPGQGAQYPGMARDLYESEPVFRSELRKCSEILEPLIHCDLVDILYGTDSTGSKEDLLNQTWLAQPALLAVEYSLAQLWMSWGIRPESVAGHSLGEYTAAVIAGIMSIEDALCLVTIRGSLIQKTTPGAMLAVSRDARSIEALLSDDLSVTALNAPDICTVGGPVAAISKLATALKSTGIAYQFLKTSHAFHCQLVDPALEPYLIELKKRSLHTPKIPILSGMTGTWMYSEEAQNPEYWVQQMRKPVRFSDIVAELLRDERTLIDIGPGQTLRRLVLRQSQLRNKCTILPAMPATPSGDEQKIAFDTIARLWEEGTPVKWSALRTQTAKRISLPTYPFEKTRHWINLASSSADQRSSISSGAPDERFKEPDTAQWLWIPSWRRTSLVSASAASEQSWVIFSANSIFFQQLATELELAGHRVIRVHPGSCYRDHGIFSFDVRPDSREDLNRFFASLRDLSVHSANLAILYPDKSDGESDSSIFGLNWTESSPLYGIQAALDFHGTHPFKICFIARGLARIESEDSLIPQHSRIHALTQTLRNEYPNINASAIDIDSAASRDTGEPSALVAAELVSSRNDTLVAYRGRNRWARHFERIEPNQQLAARPVRENAAYVIFGGLGNVGLIIAHHLAKFHHANLVLVSRTPMPERNLWQQIMEIDPQTTISKRIKAVLDLERIGVAIDVIAADLTNSDEVVSVLDRCIERFGLPYGVIHAAGITSGSSAFCSWPNLRPDLFAVQEETKFIGSTVLAETLRGRGIPLVLFISSNSSIVGGFGFAAYAAASCAMNSVAEIMATEDRNTRWVSASWDHWPEDRSSETPSQLEELYGDIDEHTLIQALETKYRYAMTRNEVEEALARVLSSHIDGHLIISTGDLNLRLTPGTTAQPGHTLNRHSGGVQIRSDRPMLKNVYVAPRTDMEATIANIWQDFLGLDKIGVNDDFFELGGHSLLATKLVAEVRIKLQVSLPLAKLFEGPTVAKMTESVLLESESLQQPSV